MSEETASKRGSANGFTGSIFQAWTEYLTDAAQRSILFLDVMRERGNRYRDHVSSPAPHVLNYDAELVEDGRKLARPVNYLLAKIIPPEDIEVDPNRRPFMVIDPRAGHGPGIGGFKADSEVGVAMSAGHTCYFVGFLPEPEPGQTIEDICLAEAHFIQTVSALHPNADGRPCVIGNCQAGWAVMMVAALRPELFGPIIIAGSPLSYWQGVHGQYPMRYSGGLLGGSWLAALASDLGAGKFDGAWLVQNFENQNPANTLWTKQYNLYSKIDTEGPRYLGFEQWWGGHINLNAEEIQFIVDELFIGNNLASGRIQMSDGTAIDLRNIRSPIVVFCSKQDNITPPQQALGWILDLYESTDDIRKFGQTIVYTVHETVGHLGIFVSSSVARKEHGEFSSNIDLIDTLPPGLYEAVFEPRATNRPIEDIVTGDWIMRCEARSLDDIRAMGGNNAADERCFATAARISEMNLSLYRTYAQSAVRSISNPLMGEWMRKLHPLRLQYEIFSSANPFMAPVGALSDIARKERRQIDPDNMFLRMQEAASEQIIRGLESYRKASEWLAEQTFMSVYGNTVFQSAMGIETVDRSLRRVAKNPIHQRLQEARIRELKARIPEGGLREAMVRGLLYAGMPRSSVDERGFEAVRRVREQHSDMSLTEFKALVRDQFYMLLIDENAALSAMRAMLPDGSDERLAAWEIIKGVLESRGELSSPEKERLHQVREVFGV